MVLSSNQFEPLQLVLAVLAVLVLFFLVPVTWSLVSFISFSTDTGGSIINSMLNCSDESTL